MFLNNEKPKNVRECMERLKKAREIVVSDEYGYTEKDFEFNSPASEELIEKCENDYGFKFPEDCKEFFKISNGCRIIHKEIYGVDYVGMKDPFVPDGCLCFGRCDGTSERLAFSKDGKFYVCYDFEPEPWDFEDFIFLLLEECEEIIIENQREKEQAMKDPEIRKKEANEVVNKWRKILEESRNK